MKITSSYSVQLKPLDFDIKPTIITYRAAVSFLIDVVNKEWPSLVTIVGELNRFREVEHLIHTTKGNKAKYNFDAQFYKFPSYLRRAAINSAIGCVSSYKSNLENWNKSKKGKQPTLTLNRFVMPSFYYKNMYLTSDKYHATIKVFLNNDWVWRKISFVKTDVKYLENHFSHIEASAPTLEKRFGTYYLRFAFSENVVLNKTELSSQRVCAVDMGLNSDAVCTIMDALGTVHDRKFINFPCEKDQLHHLCNRIKKKQRQYGPHSVHKLWAYATHLNNELSVKIATAIVNYAISMNADTIVFEYLDMKNKIRGKSKQKLHLWRKNGIQAIATHKAHRSGIRISRVCAKNTSALAYDGSGHVIRDSKNHALATFANGKHYNCDLSASYNIGARYFIRELLKPVGATQRSLILAKVPELERRTTCTYHTLLELNKALTSA